MRRRLLKAWFLIVLAIALIVGLSQGPSLTPAADAVPRTALIAGIMFLTALPIDLAASSKGKAAWAAVGLAVLLSSVVAPLFGWAASLVTPARLATGVIVAAASPCTLASGIVWVRRGNGNDAVAMLVTLITNLGCFLVMPFWLTVSLGSSFDGEMPNLIPKLLACVVAPIVVAQTLRRLPAVKKFSQHFKPALSVAAQIGVLSMAFIGAIRAGDNLHNMPESIAAADWLLVILATAVVHVGLLALGWRGAKALGMATPEAVSVAISGSQKTLAVGVGIALEFGGLAIFPMIAYHVQQLLIDTVFVDRIRNRPEAG